MLFHPKGPFYFQWPIYKIINVSQSMVVLLLQDPQVQKLAHTSQHKQALTASAICPSKCLNSKFR